MMPVSISDIRNWLSTGKNVLESKVWKPRPKNGCCWMKRKIFG